MFWEHSISKWVALIVAYAITTFLLVFLRPLVLRIGLVDIPDQRKLHQGRVPVIGGLCMFCGFVFASTLLPLNLQDYRALFAAAALLVFIGILDDFKELSARSRLVGQLLAALCVVIWGKVFLCDLGDLFAQGDIVLPMWLGWILSIFAIMSLINATNMMDGLDGLAGLLSLVSSSGLLLLAMWHQNAVMMGVLGVLMAVIIAFLQFNLRFNYPSRIFMGDAGSMFLGVVLVWFAIRGSQIEPVIARPVSMLWILAIPICEILTVVGYRALQRRSPMKASRDHMHYLLLRNLQCPGWKVSVFLAFVGVICGAIGVLGEIFAWQEWIMFFGFLTFFVVYAMTHLWLANRTVIIKNSEE